MLHLLALILATVAPLTAAAEESKCFGTVSNGRIEGSVKLPTDGPNFKAYSILAATLGRTYVHSKVAAVIVETYSVLHKLRPATVYVYGETGWPSGGRFRPHRTHQNGLSVDFFVPVRDQAGKSVLLPTGPLNRFGYDIEFNSEGQYLEYVIDFEALAAHLYHLHVAAKAHDIDIALVIIDSAFLPKLFATPRGEYLRQNLPFMKGKPWVRHDEHYHVDFKVTCGTNAG